MSITTEVISGHHRHIKQLPLAGNRKYGLENDTPTPLLKCQSAMRVIVTIKDQSVIRAILEHHEQAMSYQKKIV